MIPINQLTEYCLNILLNEVFSHIRKEVKKEYITVARENSLIHNKACSYFVYEGILYPPASKNYQNLILNLHFSLYPKMKELNNREIEAGYHYVRNFFSSILTYSSNDLVLNALLPTILIGKLKSELNVSDFDTVNQGAISEPIETTLEHIADIKEHFSESASILRMLLMDKLLLKG